MAQPEETSTDASAAPAEIILQVVPVAPRAQTQVTLDAVFMQLCEALVVALDEDLPGSLHAEEIMGWYANGNTVIAWQHAVLLLEQAIGMPLRGMT